MSLSNTLSLIYVKKLLNNNLDTLKATRRRLAVKDMGTHEIDEAINETLKTIMDLEAGIEISSHQSGIKNNEPL